MWNYTNMPLGNNHTAALQGAMPPLSLFSIVAALPVYVVSIIAV
jgi:hypothetical protein